MNNISTSSKASCNYALICACCIALIVLILKPIYTRDYALLSHVFAPTYLSIQTSAPCEAYSASFSTEKKPLAYDKPKASYHFFPIYASSYDKTPSLHICALARNSITAPIADISLHSTSLHAMRAISFINLVYGSNSIYIDKATIEQDIINPSPTSNTPSAIQNSYTPKNNALESSSYTLSLASYKLLASSTILNQQDSIILAFIYYFLQPEYLFIILFCYMAYILNKPYRTSQISSPTSQISITTPQAPNPLHPSLQASSLYPPSMQAPFTSNASPQAPIKPLTLHHIAPYLILLGIVLLGIILRIYHYNSQSLWDDELYSVGVSAYPFDDFSSIMKDPGNPPFYNLLLKLWLLCFGYTSEAARSLSVVLGSIGIVNMFFFLHKASTSPIMHDKKDSSLMPSSQTHDFMLPLLGALCFALSFVAIGASHEVRGYVLELSVMPLVLLFLISCLEKPSLANSIGYVLSGIIAVNTHYFGAIIIASSFLAAYIMLPRAHIWKILMLNILIALSLAPFFITTAWTNALMDTGFNTWIQAPSLDLLLLLLPQGFGSTSGAFVLLVCCIMAIFVRHRFARFCLLLSIFGVLIPFLLSFIRPIFYPKYALYVIYPFLLALLTSMCVYMARRLGGYGHKSLILLALMVCMLSVALLDYRISPIGVGDNSRAKLQFITADTRYEKNAIILDLSQTMAIKQRQYGIYGFMPQAQFLRITEKDLAQAHFAKGTALYIDNYFLDFNPLPILLEKGASIYAIPFAFLAERNLKESLDVIYKAVF